MTEINLREGKIIPAPLSLQHTYGFIASLEILEIHTGVQSNDCYPPINPRDFRHELLLISGFIGKAFYGLSIR